MARERTIPLLLRVAHAVRRRHRAVCERHGLTFQQFNVLRVLAGAARAGEGGLLTMELAERLIEPGVGITRLVTRLEARGLLASERPAADARRRECRLTNAGRELLTALAPEIRAEAEAELRGFDDARRGRLDADLARLLANCSEPT